MHKVELAVNIGEGRDENETKKDDCVCLGSVFDAFFWNAW